MGRRSRLLAWTATVVAFAAVLSAPALAAAPASRPAYVPGQLLVRFRDPVGPTARAAIRGRHDARLRHALLIHNLQLLQLPAGQSVDAAAASFRGEPDVLYAEPNFMYRAATVPNDPFFPQLWGLNNTGQAVGGAHGSPAADINAPAAWNITTGSSTVKVAVVDTGIRAEHPDLAGRIGTGHDWVDGDSDPEDENGHGTHVAGIIGADGNNGVGVAGVDWHAQIIPLRVLNAGGVGDAANVADAFAWAGAHGVKVVNASLGGTGDSNAVAEAIRSSSSTLFVVAAGNSTGDIDDYPFQSYPCDHTNANLMCVAATDRNDELAYFSNWGPVSVDIAAPGVDVESTYVNSTTMFSDDFESDPGSRWTFSPGWQRMTDWSTGGSGSLGVSMDACGDGCTAQIDGHFPLYDNQPCTLDFNLDLHLTSDTEWLSVEDRPYNIDSQGFSPDWTFKGDESGHFNVPVGYNNTNPAEVRFNLMRSHFQTGDRVRIDDVRLECLDYSSPANSYQYLSGTSMATPYVSGVAALVLAHDPTLSPVQVKEAILAGADRVPELHGKVASGGRLDAYGALTAAIGPIPAAPPSGTISTVAGNGQGSSPGLPIPGDGGPATSSPLTYISRVRAMPGGGYLVADSGMDVVRRVWPNGTITTVAGNRQPGWSGDGGPATQAALNEPAGVSPTADGGFLVVTVGDGRVRRVSPGGIISTVAGNGGWNEGGDGGPATSAGLNEPVDVAATADGGFLVLEDQGCAVRKVSPNGTISTVAGVGWPGAYWGDGGPARFAAINYPAAIATTPDGGYLIADSSNRVIRKVAPDGTISTVAGNGAEGFSGDGGQATNARLDAPADVAPMPDGGFLIADVRTERIRRVAPDRTIDTVAGLPTRGFSGDGGPATSAELYTPHSVAATPDGGYLIGDTDNYRVRAVTPPPTQPASSPHAPRATTTRASSVQGTSADLNGTVYAGGQPARYHFEWGSTTAYGNTTPDLDAGSGTFASVVAATIGSLTPGATYHFRIVASNATGTSRGADESFTAATGGTPPTAITGPVTVTTSQGLIFNGTVNPRGTPTQYRFEWGRTTDYGLPSGYIDAGSDTADHPVSIKATNGYTFATTYHYRLVAKSSAGTTYGADQTFTTGRPGLPAATTYWATSVGQTTATLNGAVDGPAYTGYHFEWGRTTDYGSRVPLDEGGPPTDTVDHTVSQQLTGLSPGTTYHFRIVADQSGRGPGYGADHTFTTLGGTTVTPPAAPAASTVAATSIGGASASIGATIDPHGGETLYHFDWGTDTSYGQKLVMPDALAGSDSSSHSVSAVLDGLWPGTTYHFRVVAVNAGGTTYGGDRNFSTPSTSPWPAPTAVTQAATAVGSGGATLNASIDAVGRDTTYHFEWGTSTAYGKRAPATSAAVGSDTHFQTVSLPVSGLSAATTYHFRVVATSSAGTASGADQSFTTPGSTPRAPVVQTGQPSSVTQSGATLNATVNPEGSATTYHFQWGTSTAYGQRAPASDGDAGSDSTDHSVSAPIAGLAPATTYHFRVVATNAGGTVNGADQVVTTQPSSPPPPPAQATATTGAATSVGSADAVLTGTVNPQGSSGTFHFEWGPTAAYGSSTPDRSAGSGSADEAVEETVSSLSAGTTYHFRVVVTNAAGTVQGEDRTFTTAAAQEPPGPAGGTASPRPGPGPVTPGAPGTPGTPGVTAQPSGHGFDVSLRMSALPDLSAMLRHGLALRLGCTRRCHVTATLFLAHRRAALGRARGTMSPPAARRLVIRIGKAGRAALRRLSDAELTLRLVFTSGSSRRQLTRRLEATTPGAGLGGGLLGSHRTRRR